MSIGFLLLANKILHVGTYTDDEIRMIYDQLTKTTEEMMCNYCNSCTLIHYNNDLELFIDLLDDLINIFEKKEEYEKCEILKNKKKESLDIMCKNNLKT